MVKYLVGDAGWYIPRTEAGEVAWSLTVREGAAEFATPEEAQAALDAFFVTDEAKANLKIVEEA